MRRRAGIRFAKLRPVEAFDGTWDLPGNGSDIYVFYNTHYNSPNRKYHQGVGAQDKQYADLTGDALDKAHFKYEHVKKGIFGNDEANSLADTGLQEVQEFYKDPQNRGVPLDLIGYSRGAFEAVKLANLLANGVPDPSSKTTDKNSKQVTYTRYWHPPMRYVGLVSPVAQMLPNPNPNDWPSSLPSGWAYMYQALDNKPNDLIYTQTTITRAAGTAGAPDEQTQDDHHKIGLDAQVLDHMIAAANTAHVPTK